MKKALWLTLIYTLLVIVWGAWVRISHSGDGCGASWPFCHGALIPEVRDGKTWIEYTHRLMSGLYGILILVLTVLLQKSQAASKAAKFWMKLTLFFTITEALLGAKLVLFGLVGQNDTPYRALIMSLHFLNSLFLTGSLTLTAAHFSNPHHNRKRDFAKIKGLSNRLLKRLPVLGFSLFLLIGMTGTVAALSNTLYPVDSLLNGLLQDLDPNSHYLIRLRGLHPTLGFLIGTGLTVLFYLLSESLDAKEAKLRTRSFALSLVFALTVILGSLNILLGSPLWLKLTHLLAAHAIWITLLLFWHSLRFEAGSASPRANHS